MNSSFVRSVVFATLLGAPLAGFGQVFHAQAGGGGTAQFTLLTGPGLLSPPHQLTLTPEGWRTTLVTSQRISTEEKIKQLTAELELLRSRESEIDREIERLKTAPSVPVSPDTLRFDFKVSPPNYQPQKGEIKFVPGQKL